MSREISGTDRAAGGTGVFRGSGCDPRAVNGASDLDCDPEGVVGGQSRVPLGPILSRAGRDPRHPVRARPWPKPGAPLTSAEKCSLTSRSNRTTSPATGTADPHPRTRRVDPPVPGRRGARVRRGSSRPRFGYPPRVRSNPQRGGSHVPRLTVRYDIRFAVAKLADSFSQFICYTKSGTAVHAFASPSIRAVSASTKTTASDLHAGLSCFATHVRSGFLRADSRLRSQWC